MARTKDKDLWEQVKRDFLTSGLSYSQLAEKYNVSISTLKKTASREGWTTQKDVVELAVSQKEPIRNRVPKEPVPYDSEAEPIVIDAMESAITQERTRYERFMNMTDALANRIEDALAIVEPDNTYSITLLARALKDLRDLQRLNKDALDIEEQRARIMKLKSDTRIVETEDGGGIIVLPEIDSKPVPPEDDEHSMDTAAETG